MRLGEHNYTDETDVVTADYRIERRILHPEYSVHIGYHDMALIKLSSAPIEKSQGNVSSLVLDMLDLRSWNSKCKRRSFQPSRISLNLKEKQL